MLSNDYEKAEQFYRKAHLKAPYSFRYALKLAACLYTMDDIKAGKEEAMALFEMVSLKETGSAQTLLQMAYFAMLTDDMKTAETLLGKALSAAPDDPEFKVRAAHFHLLTGNHEEAEDILLKLMISFPDRIFYKKILADFYISLNRMADAGLMVQDIENIPYNEDYQAELIQGKLLFMEGYPIYGASHLQSAVELLPGAVNAHYLLGMTFLAAGLEHIGEDVISQVLEMNPDHSDALLAMAGILYKRSESSLSLKYLDRLLKNEPENFRGYMLKGVNYITLEEYDNAETNFIKALAAAPLAAPLTIASEQRAVPFYYLGLTSQLMGRKRIAAAYYEKSMGLNSGFADLMYRYTALLMELGKYPEAREKIDYALSQNPENPYLLYVAAKVALGKNDSDGALAFLQKGLQKGLQKEQGKEKGKEKEKPIGISRTPEDLYLLSAKIYAEKNDVKAAIQVLNSCITEIPSSKDAWIMFAELMLKKKDYKSALILMQNAGRAIPDSPEILSNIAWLHLQTKLNDHTALEYARAAYDLNPLDSAIADTLGWAYYRNNALSQAYWILNNARKNAPDNAILLYHLGMVLYRKGDLSGARKHLQASDQQASKQHASDQQAGKQHASGQQVSRQQALSDADRREMKSILIKLAQ